jgi:DNA-binding MarR family transcriptional regulator
MQRSNGAARSAAARKGNGVGAGGRRRAVKQAGLALEVLGKLREVYRAAKLHFSAASKPAGVSGAELWALWELHRRPGLRVSELAALLSLRQSTVSNLIEGLGQTRLVSRKRNDPDGRVVRLYLTRAGQKVVASAPRSARGVLPDALERLSAQDLRRLHAQLDRLLGAMAVRAPGAAKARLQNV